VSLALGSRERNLTEIGDLLLPRNDSPFRVATSRSFAPPEPTLLSVDGSMIMIGKINARSWVAWDYNDKDGVSSSFE